MKNLENYGVQELNAKEIKETDGGFLDLLLSFVIGAAIDYEIKETIEGWNVYYSL